MERKERFPIPQFQGMKQNDNTSDFSDSAWKGDMTYVDAQYFWRKFIG